MPLRSTQTEELTILSIMLTLEEAQAHILAAMSPLAAESVSLCDALGRFAAEDVTSPLNLPIFDNSAMDGYAVQTSDVTGAGRENPVALRVIGRVAAGEGFAGSVAAGTCVRIFTGSPMPSGADAVVMQEDTIADTADAQKIKIIDAVKRQENVRFRGEDVKVGFTILPKGAPVTLGRLSLLAATGISSVRVGRKPVIGLLATGSELVESGQPLAPGKIYESNRLGLAVLANKAGAATRIYPLVADDLKATQTALEKAFAECDAVVTSGGVSVGEFDFVKAAFAQMKGDLSFWKVAIRPGKPFAFGRWHEKFLFGVPGNPVSALVTFFLLVQPALRCLQGAALVKLPSHPGVLAEPLANPGDRPHFARVTVDETGHVRLAGQQASHILNALAHACGLVEVPTQTTWRTGTTVPVLRWD